MSTVPCFITLLTKPSSRSSKRGGKPRNWLQIEIVTLHKIKATIHITRMRTCSKTITPPPGVSYSILSSSFRSSSTYSTVPSIFSLPLWTFFPSAFAKSSTVHNLPPSVNSLNQPRWSAIKCLMIEILSLLFWFRNNKDDKYLFLHPGHCTITTPFRYAPLEN